MADDYSWQRGNHNLKFGVNFRRNDITDYTPGGFLTTIPAATFSSEASFFKGTVDTFQQAFAVRPPNPWRYTPWGYTRRTSGPSDRISNSRWRCAPSTTRNPVCQTNCIARLANSFANISHDPNEPYNQAIDSGLHQALPNYQNIGWGPRLGFAWQPMGRETTVIRGGGGFFYDVFPGAATSSFATNSPVKNTFIASGLQLAPGLPGSAQTATTVANSAFVAGFNNGLNISQIEAGPGGSLFSPPAFFNSANNIHYPQYQEWNLEIQQALGSKMSLWVNYVGNHGTYLALVSPILNAFCNSGAVPFNPAPTAAPCTAALGISWFAGLPTQPIDPRFSTVTEASNPGVSNYNGVTVQFTRKFASLQVGANYTYSHALDDISNGGFLPFNFDTNTAILAPQSPLQFKKYNYGNADYDARQQFALNYVYNTPKMKGWTGMLANWTIAGTVFARTGLPFTVIDGGTTGTLGTYNYGPLLGLSLFADSTVGTLSCGSSATTTPCLTNSQFASPVPTVPGGVATFGNQRRNQVYGPNFWNTDLTLMKNFRIPHTENAEFQVGVQAFNLFNHANFDQPIGDVSNGQFGSIVNTVGTPTSIFGSALGGNSSPRALQIRGQITF